MYLFQKIEELSIQYNTANKIIAEFVLREKANLHNYSMQEIADLTYTSKPTLVRFAKKLDFVGWREFMKAFMEEALYMENNYSDISPNLPFNKTDSTKDVVSKLSSLQVESILDTANLIDINTLEGAVDILLSARQIVVFGVSPNTYIAELFRRKMTSIGKLVIIQPCEEGGMVAKSLSESDCAIIISYSGNCKDKEPMKFIDIMKQNKVKIIGITSGEDNYIREELECVLTISSRERLYSKIAGFSTEESIMHVLNILYSCYFARNYEENLSYKINNSKEFECRRTAMLSDMREDSNNH